MGGAATVFGLDVSANVDLPFLSGSAPRTGRALRIELAGPTDPLARWPASAAVVCDQRERDGSVNFQIEADADAGFLIWGPRYGRHRLSCDGRRVTCCVSGEEPGWQRLLIAQVLPFAAALQGLEVFHASAVATPFGAVALVGPSGVGKTSLAIEMCRSGAAFLADDVLALERSGESLLAHPGTAVAGLARADARRLRSRPVQASADPLGGVLADDHREQLVQVRSAGATARLAAMFFLERDGGTSDATRFVALADARELLSSTFNSVLTDGVRLHRLLDVCALAARGRLERVLVGDRETPVTLARALARRVEAALT